MLSGLRAPGADLGFSGGMEGHGVWAWMGAWRYVDNAAGLAVGPTAVDVAWVWSSE